MRIRPELLIGLVLVLAAFVAFFLVANILNPPPTRILVASRDIAAGEALSPALAELAEVALPQSALFVREADLAEYEGAVFVEAVHQDEPLHKASLVLAGNPAAAGRSALALDDPNLVAFVIPVSPETAPGGLQVGDRVDLTLGVGSATFLSGVLASVPTPDPFEPREVFVGGQVTVDGQQFLTPVVPSGAFLPTPEATPTPRQTEPALVSLPIAKTLVRSARVLEVVYKRSPNPAFTGSESDSAYLRGDVQAIVVAIPRGAQEVVTFALANGQVRVSVRSPLANSDADEPTMGMSWDDLVAFFYAERALGLSAIDGQTVLLGPGASALWPTQLALMQPTATATQLPTTTPTPTPVPEGEEGS